MKRVYQKNMGTNRYGWLPTYSKRTYYRKRPEVVQALSSILWGYTSKECIEMLDKFFPKIW